MKKLLLTALMMMLVCLPGFTQDFNGRISYKFEVKGEHTARLAAMMPQSMDLYFLDKDMLFRTHGGTLSEQSGDFLTKNGEKVFYIIVHAEKTVYRVDPEKENIDQTDTPAISQEAAETLNGYHCRKYLLQFPATESREIYQYVWYTDDIKITKPQTGGPMGMELFRADIPGFPVKIVQYITVRQEHDISFTQEITLDNISKAKPDAALFKIPPAYQLKDGSEFGK